MAEVVVVVVIVIVVVVVVVVVAAAALVVIVVAAGAAAAVFILSPVAGKVNATYCIFLSLAIVAKHFLITVIPCHAL